MSTEKMREEFEVWWSDNMNTQEMDLQRCSFPMQKPDFIQPYACHETQRGWLSWAGSWQASRASIVVELPSNARMYFNGAPAEAYTDGIQCWHGGVSAAKQAIEALGLRVKP